MPQRLPPRLLQAYEAVRGSTLKAVADVARGVHAASEPPSAHTPPAVVRQLKRLEAEALLAWAERKERLFDSAAFDHKWIEQGSIGGQENDVYLEGRRVFKRNNLSFHLSYADFFDRVALHHLLFPGAPLRFEGFVEHPVGLLPLLSQPVVRARRGARRTEVASFMRRLGFERTRHDDYHHPEGILVEDLHDENVFLDESNDVIAIDPVIYLVGTRPSGKTSSANSRSRHPSRRSLLPGG